METKQQVATSAVIPNARGEILLVRTPKRGWEAPGGQVEGGETLIAAVQREVLEETGVTVELGLLTGIYNNLGTPPKMIFNFLARYLYGDLTPSAETPEVGWYAPEVALEMIAQQAMRVRVRDALAFNGKVIYRAFKLEPYVQHEEQWV